VVNNLTGYAFTQGTVLIKSDGTPWRPLVHIEDISRAYLAVLEAPRELVHNEAFNVGRSQENYQIRDIAEIVKNVVPGSQIRYAEGAGPDLRCYKVDCSKIESTLPAYQPQWTVAKGVQELYASYKTHGLTYDTFVGSAFLRIKTVRRLIDEELLTPDLRWVKSPAKVA
jgi:nucleoside-diphosphate-sugar epimerase